MATIVDCPTCTRKLNVPEDLLGRPVRCPDCGGTFEAGGSASLQEPAASPDVAPGVVAPPADGRPDDEATRPQFGTPYSVTAAPGSAPPGTSQGPAGAVRPCPVCGGEIAASAVQCRFCGENLADEDDRPWERRQRRGVRRDCEPHRGTMILVFGILSLVLGMFGLPLGIIAWVMGHGDLKKIKAGAMDPEGRGLTLAGKICGMVGTILQCFTLLLVIGEMAVIFGILIPRSMAAKPVPVATPVAPPPPPRVPPPLEAPAPGGP